MVVDFVENMAPYPITPAQLELTEGPTELVRLYVEFREINGELHKGYVGMGRIVGIPFAFLGGILLCDVSWL